MILKHIFGIFIIILFLFAEQTIYGVQIEKEFELIFDSEPQYFVINGEIHKWANGKLDIYSNKDSKRSIEVLKKGEGPGDFLIIQKIFYENGKYHFWDRQLKRMTVFSKDWQRINIKKYNLPLVSAFIGKVAGKMLFKWNAFKREENKTFIVEQAGFVDDDSKQPIVRFKGEWTKGKEVNHDRPHLLYSLTGSTLYYADNQDYRIFSLNLQKDDPSPSLLIEREVQKNKWKEEFADLQYEIIRKPEIKPAERYPGYIPPLFAIAADKDLIVAVTNEKIGEKKAKLDFFQTGKYLGSVIIPILYQQHFVFPIFLNFPPDIYISGRSLYTCHYFYETDQYKIIKWRRQL